jgi:THO complex subunit 3
MTHVAWNCDGKKLAAVGIDKSTRIWSPDKSVSFSLKFYFQEMIMLYSTFRLDGVKGCDPFLRRAF